MAQVNANHRWARVLRETENGFVEFEFFVADKDLCVELILPAPAFKEFCANNQVRYIERDGTAAAPPAEPANLLRRIK